MIKSHCRIEFSKLNQKNEFILDSEKIGLRTYAIERTKCFKEENILKGSLDSIPSPSPSVKIQIMGGKVCLRCKGKTLLSVVDKLLETKSLLTSPSNVLPLHLKQTFPHIILIFTEGEDDGIKSRLPFKIFFTLIQHTSIKF